jgi:hypothetical protein
MTDTPNKGPLRQAIDNFISDNPITIWWNKTKDLEELRASSWDTQFRMLAQYDPQYKNLSNYQMIARLMYIYLGNTGDFNHYGKILGQFMGDKTTWIDRLGINLKDIIDTGTSDPDVQKLIKVIGTIATEPILSTLESAVTAGDSDPKAIAQTFEGVITTMTTLSGVMNLIGEAASLGQIKAISEMFMQQYWNLGLGFLGWQVLSPLLDYGMKPSMQRYYAKLSRYQRFTETEMRDLYALGEVSQDDLKAALQEGGWRDQDIQQWIKLAYKSLPESDAWDLFDSGDMSQDELIGRLRGYGYDPADIPLMLKDHANQTDQEAKTVTLSTVRTSYKEDLISEAEYRSLLASLKKNPQEIDLLDQIDTAAKSQAARELSISQIKGAYTQGVITRIQAIHEISVLGYASDSATILMQTWDNENSPSFLKLNKSTILDAYRNGVISRGDASSKLQAIGYTPEDAELNIKLLEVKNPQILLPPDQRTSKVLTPGNLTALVVSGLLSPEDMQARLVTAGYSQSDAESLTDLARIKATQSTKPLTQSDISQAYVTGVITRDQAKTDLVNLGFEQDAAETILLTLEKENVAAFFPGSNNSLTAPSISVLVKAYNNGIIDQASYYAKAAEIGYSTDDANLYLLISESTASSTIKTLSQAQVADAYDGGYLTHAESQDRLTAMGYAVDDANLILRMKKADVSDTDQFTAMIAGTLNPDDAISALLADKYTATDIKAAFDQLSATALAQLGINITLLDAAFDELITSGS